MSVVRDFCAMGWPVFHTSPISSMSGAREAWCFGPACCFTVEPMINLGRPHVKVLSDGWTAVTVTARCRLSSSTRSGSSTRASKSYPVAEGTRPSAL